MLPRYAIGMGTNYQQPFTPHNNSRAACQTKVESTNIKTNEFLQQIKLKMQGNKHIHRFSGLLGLGPNQDISLQIIRSQNQRIQNPWKWKRN